MKYVILVLLTTLLISGCSKKEEVIVESKPIPQSEEVIILDAPTVVADIEETHIEEMPETGTVTSAIETILVDDTIIEVPETEDIDEPTEDTFGREHPEDFRIDTEILTPDEQLIELLKVNEDILVSNGLSVDTLSTANWEYREEEGIYSVVAGLYPNFHAVVVDIVSQSVEVDPN